MTSEDSALRDALLLLEAGQSLAQVGSWVSELTGSGKVVWSKQCYRLFGIQSDTPMGLDEYFRHVHPDDAARVRAVRDAAIARGEPYVAQYRILRSDGSTRWLNATATVERAADGTPLRLIGVCQDITEQKRTLDELRESEARYRRIVETTNEGVWTLDPDGNTTYMNARMAAMLGYDGAELIGTPVQELVHDDFYRAGIAGQIETTLRRKDGSTLWVLLESTPIVDEDGRHEGALAMVTDITERRAAEQAYRQSQDALQRIEDQLRQAQKMEAIGRLAGGVAHDFNNLLSVILSYAGLSLDSLRDGDPLRADMEEIMSAAERAAALTRQLLAFSRRQVLAPKVLDLNETILSLDRMLHRLLGEDIALSLRLAPGLGRVHADEGQLEQVIMNLAVNARDAMAHGGTLVLETSEVEIDGVVQIKLSVADTGAGMNAATRARIFEPFFTTKDSDKGTGLGLSTVLGIVQQSGGQISVWSEPGKGSRFEILLPRTIEAAPLRQPIPPTQRKLRGSETILLVEDDEQVRALALTVLRRNGYRVLEARNAGEALLIAERFVSEIDLLLTDVVMPHCSGYELVERLRAKRPDLPAIYMSGYPDVSSPRDAELESDIPVLSKPLQPEPLLRIVRSALD